MGAEPVWVLVWRGALLRTGDFPFEARLFLTGRFCTSGFPCLVREGLLGSGAKAFHGDFGCVATFELPSLLQVCYEFLFNSRKQDLGALMHDGIVSRILLNGLKMGHSGDSEKIRVLIVEPQAQQRQLLVSLAQQSGFVVHQAEDGEAALKVVAAKSPDIIVFDLILPRIDGVRLMEELTLRYGLGRPRALVLTDASRIDLARAWLGAEDYLLKPVDERRFTALLRRLAVAVIRRNAG